MQNPMPRSVATLLGHTLLMASVLGCHLSKGGNADTAVILEIYNSDYKMHSNNEKELVKLLSKNLSPHDLKQTIIRIENEKITVIKAIEKATSFQYQSNLQALKPEVQAAVKTNFDISRSNVMEGPLIDEQARERIIKALKAWSHGKAAKECFSQ